MDPRHFFASTLAVFLIYSDSPLSAQEHAHEEGKEFNFLTGEGAHFGGFIFPELFITGTGGLFEPGTRPEDLAVAEHDPQREATIQGIALHLGINLDDRITGLIAGFGHLKADGNWHAQVEEAYLHYHLTEEFIIGGGRFLSTVGWQSSKHLHDWNFVNQNLTNGRFLNEGELITEGGRAIIKFPGILDSVLTIGAGGVLTHSHEHEEEEEEEHAFEIDGANFNNWVASLDYKFRLPGLAETMFSTSFVTGENGFGELTRVYGGGFETLLIDPHGEDHGSQEHGLERGALLFRSELMARKFTAIGEEDETVFKDGDRGFSNAFFYGLSDLAILSLRHDWVSDLPGAGISSRHRLSPALSSFLGEEKRIQARLQYDYTQDSHLESEHAAWLQINWRWGGGHGHDH